MNTIRTELKAFILCCSKIGYSDHKAQALCKILLEELKKDFYERKRHGCHEFFFRNKFHRDGDEPAVMYHNGGKEWWKHGKRHRGQGKAAIKRSYRLKEYWEDGVLKKEKWEEGGRIFLINHK